MKTLNPENYPNFLDHITIRSDEIEFQISNYPLEFSKIKDKRVEWRMAFPMFLPPFYRFIYENNRVPKQEEHWQKYLEKNNEHFSEKNYDEDILAALKARVYRTYPSLVRDLHFISYVKEKLDSGNVIYNDELDIKEGIDMLIIKDNSIYSVNLYTKTHRAQIGRAKKEFRHEAFSNIVNIELPVEFKGSMKCGQFFLYKEREYNQLLSLLIEKK